MEKDTENDTKPRKYFLGIGRRKTAVAQVRLYPAKKGVFTINKEPYKDYFPLAVLQEISIAPLKLTANITKFDTSVIIRGGGLCSQAEAARLGIARALVKFDKELRKALKAEGYMSRDPRVKERKKPGLKGARRAPQWQKR